MSWLTQLVGELPAASPPATPTTVVPERIAPQKLVQGRPPVGWLLQKIHNPQAFDLAATGSTSTEHPVSLGGRVFNPARYPNSPIFTFEAVLDVTDGVTAKVALFDVDADAVVVGSELSSNTQGVRRKVSGALSIATGDRLYVVRLWLDPLTGPEADDRVHLRSAIIGVTYLGSTG
jgi:hypothetical protein